MHLSTNWLCSSHSLKITWSNKAARTKPHHHHEVVYDITFKSRDLIETKCLVKCACNVEVKTAMTQVNEVFPWSFFSPKAWQQEKMTFFQCCQMASTRGSISFLHGQTNIHGDTILTSIWTNHMNFTKLTHIAMQCLLQCSAEMHMLLLRSDDTSSAGRCKFCYKVAPQKRLPLDRLVPEWWKRWCLWRSQDTTRLIWRQGTSCRSLFSVLQMSPSGS